MSELVVKAIQEQLFRHFTRFDINALRALLEIVGHPSPASIRRDEAIFYLIEQLSNKAAMRKLWDLLDGVTQQALSLTVHTTNGVYQPETILLRYGQVPPTPQRYWSGYLPTTLDLFLGEDQNILSELLPILRVVAPKPEPWQIPPQPEPPQRYESIGFERSLGAEAGLQDLTAVLALIGRGRIQVTEDNLPTVESIEEIVANLAVGDFCKPYEGQPVAEAIRPVGLVRFLLGCDMAGIGVRNGYYHTLQIRPLGWEWLQRPSSDLLLDAIERWSRSDLFDEMGRFGNLRGADRDSETRTKPAQRRERILEALSWCPNGVWLKVDDFFKAIKLWQFDFVVDQGDELTAVNDSTGRKLNISELKDPWKAVQGAYTLAVLWETLACLGALDLAYTEPQHAPSFLETPTETWQRPIHPYSRYDGLAYFRINDFGAYLFGHTHRYALPRIATAPFYEINGKHTFRGTREPLAPYQRQLIQLLAISDEQGAFHLDKPGWLAAQQNEGTLEERRQLLISRHHGPLKPAVEEWLEQCEADSTALRKGRTMITIQARRPEVRNAILEDAELKRYCLLLDERTLLIPSSREHAFLRRVLELGYGMVGGTLK